MNAHTKKFDVAAAHWPDAAVLIFAGQGDTHINTGAAYATRTLAEIFAMPPGDRPKGDGWAMIPSTYNGHDGRSHEVQRDRGRFVALTGDIDKGDHQLARIKALVTEFAGDAAWLIYSSPHSRPGDHRWRIILPLENPAAFDLWADAQHAFYDFMQDHGVDMDRALARAGQPVFLPNVPAAHAKTGEALRGEDGRPLYYIRATTGIDAPGLRPDVGPIADRIAAIHERREEGERAREKLRAEARKRAEARAAHNANSSTPGDGASMIDAFNASNTIAALLPRYKYERDPRNAADWRSPNQTGQTYATRDFGDFWVSLSESDAAAGLGAKCASGCFGDAFDLYVHYEHGGNVTAACKALHDERRASAFRSAGGSEDHPGTAEESPSDASKPAARDWPFRIGKAGVEKRIERQDKDTGEVTIEWKWFCSHLEVAADTRSADGEDWGRLLKITDRDGQVKEWAMPMAMLAGDGTAYRERLLSLGLIMAPGRFAREALHEYISTARPPEKARCVNRIGWAGEAFALPRVTFEGKE